MASPDPRNPRKRPRSGEDAETSDGPISRVSTNLTTSSTSRESISSQSTFIESSVGSLPAASVISETSALSASSSRPSHSVDDVRPSKTSQNTTSTDERLVQIKSSAESSNADDDPENKNDLNEKTLGILRQQTTSDTVESVYSRLPLFSSWSIRLLRLLPASSFHHDLRGELSVTKLDEDTNFDALSYTWGTPFEGQTIQDNAIEISGHSITITGNLDHALRRLRYKGESRYLWIDALCIDQGNDRERGHQIEIMEHIYSRAGSVVVWLGEDSAAQDGKFAFEFCRLVERHGARIPHRAANAYRSHWPNYKALSQRFASRRYFSRRWIIQEICHAQEVNVHCGVESASLSTLSACVRNLPSSRRAMDSVKELCTTFSHLKQALQDWKDGHLRSSQITTLSDFVWMLQKFHNFDCIDGRDRIFALVSLWKDDDTATNIIGALDYFMSCNQLYMEFAARLITAHTGTHTLSQLLSIAAHQVCNSKPTALRDSALPSWVVDWRLDPAPRIGPDDVSGNIQLFEPLEPPNIKLHLHTRSYGQIVEADGHYRDWVLISSQGLRMPSFYGLMDDKDYIAALGGLCPKVLAGDVLCHPYSTYRARHGHVGDAATVLRSYGETPGVFRIVGRFPLDLFWYEAQGEERDTGEIPSESMKVVIE